MSSSKEVEIRDDSFQETANPMAGKHIEIEMSDLEQQKIDEHDSQPLTTTNNSSSSGCCCCSTKKRCCSIFFSIILTILGILLLGGSIAVQSMASPYIDTMFREASTVCGITSDNYGGWESNFENSIPNYQKLTLFDIDNPVSVYEGGKAEVEEIGPFTYQCWAKKFNVDFRDSNKFVSYNEYSVCSFVPSLSCPDCHESRYVVSYSPGYAKLLTRVVNEGTLHLKIAGCTTAQIKAIGDIDPYDTAK